MGEAVIVAGIGSRKGVTAAEVLAALDAALGAHGHERCALGALATTEFKKDERGIIEAAELLGLGVLVVESRQLPVAEQHPHSVALRAPPLPLPVVEEAGQGRQVRVLPRHFGGGEVAGEAGPSGNGCQAETETQRTPKTAGAILLSHSPLSLSIAGTSSVSETAALLGAGPGAALLGPRVKHGRVTCALAQGTTP